MSLSNTLSNALSGLTVNGRVAELISGNVANANTEGYARREIELSNSSVGGLGNGVTVAGIRRAVDPVLLADRRASGAVLERAHVYADFYNSLETSIGLPGQPGALTERMASLDAAFIQAASRPDSDARLQSVVDSAIFLADGINLISDGLQEQRLRADQGIAKAVTDINEALSQIAEINGQLLRDNGANSGDSGLYDQRQRLIDFVSEFVPLREVTRTNGTVALFTEGGAVLVDINSAEFGFSPTNTMTPYLDVSLGTLSGLTINGNPVEVSNDAGPVKGGRLAALFDIRDGQVPSMQAQLDGMARDLIERFQDPAVDTTLLAGEAGLFTDDGAAFDPLNELGLADRISINALVNPSEGGDLWRIRDGINAASSGPSGDATLLNGLSSAFQTNRLPASGGYGNASSATGIATDFLSSVSTSAHSAEISLAFRQAHNDTFVAAELRNGVDTDAEMQNLLRVEQAYAANAKVVTTVDELLQTLLAI